jgi:tripartite-type tricarboxylate transporter receptor subunit TctC
VHPALPVKSTKELIALARAKPGQLAYAMPGIGSITHMSTAYFLSTAKINMLSVPYKSTGAVMTELLAGQTQMIMGGLLPLQPFIQAGRLRPLAVTTAKRWPTLPDVPAIAETLPGYEVDSWYGAIAPKGTPPAIVERLNAAMNRILLEPEMKKNLDQQGVSVSGGTAAHFEQRIRADYDRWVKVVREAGLKPE